MTRSALGHMACALVLLVGCAGFVAAGQQTAAITVFTGTPQFKISEEGVERLPEAVDRQAAPGLGVVITRIGDDYYWASRENTPMVAIDGAGAYVTYVASNGSGYVRVIKPEMKQAASLAGGAEAAYDYVEHALIGLRSVTYYGVRAP